MSADGVDRQEVAWKIVGGQEDFIAQADFQGPQGQLHGESAAAARYDELLPKTIGQRLGETFSIATMVFSPGTVLIGGVQRVADIIVQDRPRRRSFRADRPAPEDR